MSTSAKPKQKKIKDANSAIREILSNGEKKEIRSFFAFNRKNTVEEIKVKFDLWIRFFFPGYVMDEAKERVIGDAQFHESVDYNNIRVYVGLQPLFIDIAYRGAAKTTRTKLFLGFAIANDTSHYRKYIKVLSEDETNSVQIVTDVYNMFVSKKVKHYYPEVFEKTPEKRAETMGHFETATNVKLLASTVGKKQRGQLQDEFRPDFIWYDDFESRSTLKSAPILTSVWNNMEEARTGLSRNGGAIYTCNYLSERGNVHKLVSKWPEFTVITPIKGRVEVTISGGVLDVTHFDGAPTWEAAYTAKQVEAILEKADDPAGEYLCSPSAGPDIYFDRSSLDKQERKKPIKEIAGFKIFHEYDPSHRYGSGHDVAGGVGLDSSTSVFIDFTQMPARVVATFKNNLIKPDVFGDEIESQANRFGRPIVAVENNKFDACIGRLKQIYDNLYLTEEDVTKATQPSKVRYYGWNTNSMSKGTMLSALKKAVSDGHLELSDPDLIAELRSYTRNDLMDPEVDPRETTRHFDLLIACAIAFMMKNFAEATDADADDYEQEDYEPTSEYESGHIQTNRSVLR